MACWVCICSCYSQLWKSGVILLGNCEPSEKYQSAWQHQVKISEHHFFKSVLDRLRNDWPGRMTAQVPPHQRWKCKWMCTGTTLTDHETATNGVWWLQQRFDSLYFHCLQYYTTQLQLIKQIPSSHVSNLLPACWCLGQWWSVCVSWIFDVMFTCMCKIGCKRFGLFFRLGALSFHYYYYCSILPLGLGRPLNVASALSLLFCIFLLLVVAPFFCCHHANSSCLRGFSMC